MRDDLDLEIGTSSAACVAALSAARDAHLGFRADAARHVNAAIAADPGCVLAQVMKGYMAMLLSNTAVFGAVDQRIAAARRCLSGATRREGLHLDALEAWRQGRDASAIAAWEEILVAYPRDLTALRLAHFAYFWSAGDAMRMRASIERVLPHWSAGAHGEGWVLGMHGFACEETGDYDLAERQGRRAVEIDASDLWAIHAVAHVMEMQARHGEGAAWVERGAAHLGGATNFRFHLAWHRALFLLEAGARAEMLACYDESVRDHASPLVQGQPDLYIDVQNAASLLMRLELLGVDVGERWTELADKAEARIGDHLIPFTVPHWMMALAATGRWSACESVLAALRESDAGVAADGGASSTARIAMAAAQGVYAHRRGAHAAAVAALFPVRHDLVRLGGSHAQRDILWQVMTDAARRAGDVSLAKRLVAEVQAARAPHAIPAFYREISRSAGPSDT
jgi:tetratricopeptide (TPR) repeat protein